MKRLFEEKKKCATFIKFWIRGAGGRENEGGYTP